MRENGEIMNTFFGFENTNSKLASTYKPIFHTVALSLAAQAMSAPNLQ